MLFQSIEGSNCLLIGDPEQGIVDIHALVAIEDGQTTITVAFEPTPAELQRLNDGKPIYVTQLTNTSFHPIRCEVKL